MNSVCFDCLRVVLLVYLVVILVCVDCLLPLHDVLTPTEKRYGWSAGNSFFCSAKMASISYPESSGSLVSGLVAGFSLPATKPLTKEPEDSGYEIEMASATNLQDRPVPSSIARDLGCVYPAHGSALNMSV